MSATAELLDKAADYIMEHGITYGRYRNENTGAVCADGALQGATGATAEANGFLLGEVADMDPYYVAYAAVNDYLHRTNGELRGGMIAWNDAGRKRTKEEVAHLFRAVATELREEEAT